ncbi:MAG: hypothetical protein M3279_11420 [Actinomycetota bacterium]|nr:hypothetical protein [Actinomycetota bacterium]
MSRPRRTVPAVASSTSIEMPRRLWAPLVAALLLPAGCGSVTFVDRVVVVNDTDYSANVDVTGDDGGWLGLGSIPPHETLTVGQVIDQGARWTFRFSYGSHDPVELEIDRRDLARAGWRVEVPPELETNLRAGGVPPPP